MENELTLDTNLDSMEGIIDPAYSTFSAIAAVAAASSTSSHSGVVVPNFDPNYNNSPSTAFDSYSDNSSSFQYHTTYLGPPSRFPSTEFSNPFATAAAAAPSIASAATTVVSAGVVGAGGAGSSSSGDVAYLPNGGGERGQPLVNGRRGGAGGDFRKVSPKTLLPPLNYGSASRVSVNGSTEDNSPFWVPPQSWAVHRDGVDREEGEYSSSDESVNHHHRHHNHNHHHKKTASGASGGSGVLPPPPPIPPSMPPSIPASRDVTLSGGGNGGGGVGVAVGSGSDVPGKHTRTARRYKSFGMMGRNGSGTSNNNNNNSYNSSSSNTVGSATRVASPSPTYASSSKMPLAPGEKAEPVRVRIYTSTGHIYHVVTINAMIDVAAMIPKLKEKLLGPGQTESYRLYLREHSRERLLSPHERPVEIVRKRLEQAGYEPADVVITNDNLNFLLKFIYKSQRLGPAEDEFTFDGADMIDLTDSGLRTIPVKLHKAAEQIIRLVLSCNPMLEIPLDFIQSCTSLCDLHLSNMSMKRVPQSVRHATTLLRLDLSKNRIADLSEAFLDNLPTLQSLNLRSNRLEGLPWYFPRMHTLSNLDLANNRLRTFPAVILNIDHLEFLDLSFNHLVDIPNGISRLRFLKDLRITGNAITRLPHAMGELMCLENLDCQRNRIVDLSPVLGALLPALLTVYAANNSISALDLSVGPVLTKLDVSHNDITQVSCQVAARAPQGLVDLKLSYAKLSAIDDPTLGTLVSLRYLSLNHNSFTSLPESLGRLRDLVRLVCSDNKLTALPGSIGELQYLRELDAHNNSLTELPVSIWNCARLEVLNLTSNLLGNWHDPPVLVVRRDSVETLVPMSASTATPSGVGGEGVDDDARYGRKGSTGSVAGTLPSTGSVVPVLPPLAASLKRLYLGENRLIDEVLHVLMIFKALKILNLSFNEFQDMPANFFTSLSQLEELYLSGNKLTSLPTEDLPKLVHLKRLYLNGNKLQTLPQELGKVMNLMVLDVGSNLLKYNINNWEFDWNWNFNKNLKYLNLSGNKRLQIKSDKNILARHQSHHHTVITGLQSLAGFTELTQLRVLGLMDVTMTSTGNVWMDIPDENEDRRVRTSSSIVNGMAYGIADALGRNDHLNIIDLVHEIRGQPGEAVFAMFGVAGQAKPVSSDVNPNVLAKLVRDRFVLTFVVQLNQLKKDKNEDVADAMRRTFLRLNQELYDCMQQSSGGGGGVGAIATGGAAAAAVAASSAAAAAAAASASVAGCGSVGSAASITSAGSISGRKMSHVSACSSMALKQDNIALKYGATGVVLYFVGKTLYVANVGDILAVVSRQGSALLSSRRHAPFDPKETERIRGANGWVSIDGKVNDDVDTSRSFGFYHHLPIINSRPDITLVELTQSDEFVIVANRSLWDYVSYQTAVDIARTEPDPMIASQKLRDFAMSYGAEGSIMIMVIGVADLFGGELKRKNTSEQPDTAAITIPRKVKGVILDRDIARLDGEVPAPVGHIAIVFTDIRNSTHLWEVNPGMPTAMRLHNGLLRRQLRLCGGYEVKTEGDAFMCSFPTALAAVWWCLAVQDQLLHESWPLEILECEDGKPIWDAQGRLIARGLSVRMGVHCGAPVCERDPITNRMDYFGPMVNRAARINGNAQGGHIMCSADVMREINASVLGTEPETEYSRGQPLAAIDAIKRLGVFMKQVGEVKLKGLEAPELLTSIYPTHLQGRAEEEQQPAPPSASASRVQLSWEQVRDLGMVCLRLEALSSNRIFKVSSPDLGGESVKAEGKKKRREEEKKEKEEADKQAEAEEEEQTKQQQQAERYLVVDPKLVLPLVDNKSTDEQLMMALDILSIRIGNACQVVADRLRVVRVVNSASDLPIRLKDALARRGGLDERTLSMFLTILETMGTE